MTEIAPTVRSLLLTRLSWNFGTSAALAAAGAVSGIFAARYLGPADRGELARLTLWAPMISGLATLGVDLAATYFSARGDRADDLSATLVVLALLQSAIAAPLYLVLTPLLFHGNASPLVLAGLMSLLIPFDLIALYISFAMNGRGDYGAFNLVRLTAAPLYAVALVGLGVSDELTVTTAAVAFVVTNGVQTLVAVAVVRRKTGFGSVDASFGRAALRFGVRAHLGRLSPQSVSGDLAIASLVLSSSSLGLFTVACAFLALPRMFAGAASLVVFPTASAAAEGSAASLVRRPIAAAMTMVVASAVVLAVTAPVVVPFLFGGAFRPSARLIQILVLGEVALTLHVLLSDVVRGSGRPGLTSIIESLNWGVFAIVVPIGALVGGLYGLVVGVVTAAFIKLVSLLFAASAVGVIGRTPSFGARPEVGQ